jgi:hypothetical protein
LPDSPFACVITLSRFIVGVPIRRWNLAVSAIQALKAGSFVQGEGPVTDDAIARNILKFVRQLDGAETDELVLKAAIKRRWLNRKGVPTRDGRRLIQSFDDLQSIGRPPAN